MYALAYFQFKFYLTLIIGEVLNQVQNDRGVGPNGVIALPRAEALG
jgi:hypothetical protein